MKYPEFTDKIITQSLPTHVKTDFNGFCTERNIALTDVVIFGMEYTQEERMADIAALCEKHGFGFKKPHYHGPCYFYIEQKNAPKFESMEEQVNFFAQTGNVKYVKDSHFAKGERIISRAADLEPYNLG